MPNLGKLQGPALEALRDFAEKAKAAGPKMPKPLPARHNLVPRMGKPTTPSKPETSDGSDE